ncbi:MAG: hypothetical protein NC095_09010 [Muribaculum sp.]|nr:hypothetical protein [Muribaculum sp.]
MSYYKYLLIVAVLLSLIGCDEGKIYPDDLVVGGEGLSVVVKGEFSGCKDYDGSGYAIVVAAFKDGDNYATVSKPLTDGSEDIVLKNVDASVSSVEVCVITRLREKVITFASKDVNLADGNTDIVFNAGEINVAPFNAINHNIFATTCVQCHGATGTSAASLNLIADEAYRNLVNVPSTVMEGEMRVAPGNASVSTLWQALATDVSEGWRFDHSNLLTPESSGFVQYWINSGAND